MGIGLALSLHNRFSANARQATRDMNLMHSNARRVAQDNLRMARRVGVGMTVVGYGMARGLANATKTSSEFNYLMRGTQAVVGATGAELKDLSATALRVSQSTIFTARQVGGAMEYMGRAGFKTGDIYKTIDAVTALGAATDTAINGKGGAADMMTNMMTAFGMGASSSIRMADVLTKTTTRSNVNVQGLHEALKYLGSAASDVKLPFEDAAAAIGVLGSAGIPGSIAGRGLSQMLTQLAKVVGPFRTQKQTDILQSIGLHPNMLKDAKGEFIPLVDMLSVFQNKLGGLASPDRLSVLTGLFNVRGARSFTPLLRATELGYNLSDLLSIVRDKSAGAAMQISKLRLDSLKGDTLIMTSAWEAFKIQVGNALEPMLRTVVPMLTNIINKATAFIKTPWGKPFVILAAGIAAVLLIGGPLLVLFTSIKLMALASTVSFASMGKTLTWAWNSSAAAATRYAAVAQGASWIGPGGQFARKGVKGFQSAATAASGASMMGGGKGIMGFIRGLSFASLRLGILGRALGVITGPVGMIITVIGALVGFKTMLKLVGYGLGTLLQGIFYMYDRTVGFMKGDFKGKTANANYNRRQAILKKSLGWDSVGGDGLLSNMKPKTSGKGAIGHDAKWADFLASRASKESDQKFAAASVNLDGKKVGEIIMTQQEESLSDMLSMDTN